MPSSILIVEDDAEINQLLVTYVQKEGYSVTAALDGEEAILAIENHFFQLIVLDLMLPKVDGLEVLRQIRKRGNAPVLIVSAKNEEVDKIVGLRLGADDYITKPFGLGEFIARIKALLRRSLEMRENTDSSKVLEYMNLRLDLHSSEVSIGGEGDVKPLTAKEFEILKLFMSNPLRIWSKLQIFQKVWQQDYLSDENTVMVHIRRLRAKIERDPSNPQYIQTVWGIGYRLGGTRKQ